MVSLEYERVGAKPESLIEGRGPFQLIHQLRVRPCAVVWLLGLGGLVVLQEADHGGRLAVGPESPRRQVDAQALDLPPPVRRRKLSWVVAF